MKNLLTALLSICLLISCSKDDTNNEMIVGEWKMTKISSTYPRDVYPGDIPMVYIFHADNTGLMRFSDGGGTPVERLFRYALNLKSLKITLDNSAPLDYSIQKLSKEELTILLDDTLITFERR